MITVKSLTYIQDEETLAPTLQMIIDFDAECLIDLLKNIGRDDAAYEIGDKLFEQVVKKIDRM